MTYDIWTSWDLGSKQIVMPCVADKQLVDVRLRKDILHFSSSRW